MPKRIVPLSDLQVRNAKPRSSDYKLSDGYGLHLLVTHTGGKLWRFQYRFDGKQKGLALGVYPEISLSDARQRRDEARKQLANDIDPSAVRRLKKEEYVVTGTTFEVVAREWFDKNMPVWSKSHQETVMSRLERFVFPVIGGRPISELKAPDILAMLRPIEARGVIETTHRCKTYCGQVFRYAVATGRVDRDPTSDLKGALQKKSGKHHAAITDPKELAALLRAIDDFGGTFIVKCALQLAPHLFIRPGELQKAKWVEFDLDAGEWRFFITKTKTNHVVPLAHQAIEILKKLHSVTGDDEYLFPSLRGGGRPMSNVAMLAALRRMGYSKDEMTVHGFRATARTILDEVLGFRPDFIEHQLAHSVRDPLGRAYNRTAHLAERRKMMQAWADYLDKIKSS